MKKVFAIIAFSLAAITVAVPVHAQISSALSVSPVIYNVTLSPGKTHDYELKIKNGLDVPVPLQVEIQSLDLSQKDETGTAPLPSIAAWVSFPEKDMIVGPREERTIPFSVTVPDRLPLGGYYGIIYLHPFSRTREAENISSKIGILILGAIGVQEVPLNKTALINPRFSPFLNESRDVALSFSVKNMALNHFSAKPFMRITPLFGKAQDVPIEEKIIFPGRTRKWDVPVSLSSFPSLWYRADLFISVGQGAQQKTRLHFIAFPFVKILILLAAVAIGGIIIKERRRIRDAIRILLHG